MKKPSKYFHSENWSYLKLTKESFILVSLIIFGREGSWIFPLAPCIAFPSSLAAHYVAVSPHLNSHGALGIGLLKQQRRMSHLPRVQPDGAPRTTFQK